MDEKKVLVKDLVAKFKFEQISGDEEALLREIKVADTNRPGLELAGFFANTQLKRIMILGDKEIAYINTMTKAQQQLSFEFLINDVTPAIVITKSHPCPPLLYEIAMRKNFPIFLSKEPTYKLIVGIITYLDEALAPVETIHGSLLSIYGKGVLICGESGMGKSEIALELIKRGHLLVADDRVDCYRLHDILEGRPAELLRNMLEIRGVGIIDVSRMFGISAVIPKSEINFIVKLEKFDPEANYDRIGSENRLSENLLGVDIPKMVLPVKEGRSMAVIIESAVTNLRLIELGIDSSREFEERVYNHILNNKE